MNAYKFLILCLAAAFIYACGAPKKVVKTNTSETLPEIESKIVFNPKSGKYDTIYASSKIDTVRWKPAPTTTKPPIGNNTSVKPKPNDGKTGGVKPSKPTDYGKIEVKAPKNTAFRSSYHITYALPFYTDKFSDLDKEMYDKSDWAMNFYAGAKLALDTLGAEGISLKINTVDTKANENELAVVLASSEVQGADVIIGTETRKNVETTALWAKQNDKVLISPYNPSADIVFDNSHFIQLNPSLQTHCEAIVTSLLKTQTSDNVTVIIRDKANEKEALQYLQAANAKAGNGVRFREIIVDEKAGMVAVDIKSYIKTGQNTTFVVPIWNNETFIYSMLKKIENAKGKNNVTVYGMPQWANFQVNGFDAFEPLHVHIPQPTYIDQDSPRVKAFQRAFYSRYNAAPDDEAYKGFDITLYTGRMLYKYGTKFNEVVDQVPYQGVETNFQFQKEKTAPNNEKIDAFDRFANKFITILKFENGYFQRAE